jgi:hypothetical protein
MDIIQYLKYLHDECLKLLPRIKFDKHHALDVTLLSLYSSLIELVGCILILMDNRGLLGVPSVFRTLLETYVEFHNLVRDPKYGYYIDANDAKEWLRVLKTARNTKNPYLSSFAGLPDLPEIITKFEKDLRSLKTRGFEPLSIGARFQRADMLDEYDSVYNFLCTEAHSNKRALINRHMEIDNDDYELVVYKNGLDDRYIKYYLDSAADLLVSASVSIHEKLESDALEEVGSFRHKLEAVRATYKAGA